METRVDKFIDIVVEDIRECRTSGVYELWLGDANEPQLEALLAYDINSGIIGKSLFRRSAVIDLYNLKVLFEYKDSEGANCCAVSLSDYTSKVDKFTVISILTEDEIEKRIIDSLL